MKTAVKKGLVLLAPLLMTPLFGYLLAEGVLNMGGGEKDLLFIIPYMIWSTLYLIAGIIVRNKPISGMLIHAIGWSFGQIIVLWLGLLIYSLATS